MLLQGQSKVAHLDTHGCLNMLVTDIGFCLLPGDGGLGTGLNDDNGDL